MTRRLSLPVNTGVYVTRVLADSPAQRAGLVPALSRARGLPTGADVITAVNGVLVASTATFLAEIDRHRPQDRVLLSVVRKGVELEVAVTLAPWPVGGNPFANSPDFDPLDRNWQSQPPYPLVPQVPGFTFPNLFPESPRK